MPRGDTTNLVARRNRMRALVEAAKFLHPHSTMQLMAHTLGAPVETIRSVLYHDLVVSDATIERWSMKVEAGIERDAAVVAQRHANVRRALWKVRGVVDDARASITRGGDDETGSTTA